MSNRNTHRFRQPLFLCQAYSEFVVCSIVIEMQDLLFDAKINRWWGIVTNHRRKGVSEFWKTYR